MTGGTPSSSSERGALAHGSFRLFLAARFLMAAGMQMQLIAIGWHIYAITQSPLHLGYVGLAQFLPLMSLSLPAGQVADRVDRRKMILICYSAIAVCAFLLFYLAGWHAQKLAPLYAVMVLLGAARAFAGPVSQAIVPDLVPPETFGNAVAWNSTAFQLATIGGPSIGGALYALLNPPSAVFLVCAVSMGLAAVFVSMVRARHSLREVRAASFEQMLVGLKYVWKKRLILGSISLDLFAVLSGGAVALLPAYAKDVLHIGPAGLGTLRSATAVGAALTAVYLAHRPLQRRQGHTLFLSVGVFALATIVFGLSRNFWVSLAALATLGAADMVSVVMRLTLVQIATPPTMRGRVSAVNMLFIGASNELGDFESGITAAWLGLIPAVVAGGVGTLAIVVIWWWLFPELRKLDRVEDARVDEAPS
jgi:MFS family permease